MNSSIESSNQTIIAANQAEILALQGELVELNAKGEAGESAAAKDRIAQLNSRITAILSEESQAKQNSFDKELSETGQIVVKPEEKLDKKDSIKSEETKNSKKDQEEKTELGQAGTGKSAGSSTTRKGPVISDAA